VDILATLRVPFVQLRLLIETPALWGVAFAASLLIGLAWLHDRRDRDGVDQHSSSRHWRARSAW